MPFSPSARYRLPRPVESCLSIPPGRATAAKPLSAFASVLRHLAPWNAKPIPLGPSSAIGGNAAPATSYTPLATAVLPPPSSAISPPPSAATPPLSSASPATAAPPSSATVAMQSSHAAMSTSSTSNPKPQASTRPPRSNRGRKKCLPLSRPEFPANSCAC